MEKCTANMFSSAVMNDEQNQWLKLTIMTPNIMYFNCRSCIITQQKGSSISTPEIFQVHSELSLEAASLYTVSCNNL